MMENNWVEQLVKLRACPEALEWVEEYDSLDEAWQVCERGDWSLWLAGKLSGSPDSDSRKRVVLAACQCARLSLKYVTPGETRPLKAIETAEAWSRGEGNITLSDVRKAADAAHDAAHDAAPDAHDAHAAHDAAYD